MMRRTTTVIGIALLTVGLAACKGDPQQEARTYLERGNQQAARQQFPEAIIEYRRAVQSDPRLGEARLQLAYAYASSGDGPNALREYARAADLLPDDTAAQVKAGNFMLIASRFQDAEGLANRMLARDANNVEAQILLANALAGLKDMDGAVAAFEKAVVMDPNRSATYSELGAVQLVSGNQQAAEAAFLKAIEIDPKSANAHLSYANFLWSTKEPARAEQEIERALELEPGNVVANRAISMYYMVSNRAPLAEPHLKIVAAAMPGAEPKYFLAEYYLRLGRIDDARATLTPLVAGNDSFVGASIRLARVEVVAKRNAEAHRVLEAALAREPKNAEALITLGKLQLSENNTVNALSTLQTAVAANPRSLPAHLALAQTHALRGSVKEATAAFNEALNLDGANTEARLGLARLQINNNTPADAVPLVLKIVAEQPRNLEARLLLLHGLIAVNDLPQATTQLNVLLQQAPGSATVQTAAGMLAAMKRDGEGAKRAYALALDADPRSYQALAGLLTAEMQSKQFGSAKALIEKQLAQMPNDPNVLLMAAQTYNAMGDAFETERALKKTVEVDPQSLQAYAMLGKMYYQQGRLDLARRELETFVTRAPKSVPANTMLGTILELQGKKDEAKQRYGQALQVDPRAAVAANNLAWINANSNGNLDMALQLAQTAKAQLPNRHEVDDTLGFIYYKKGLSSLAIESLSASATRQPDNPSYNYHLALAHHQNGDTEEARKLLEKALKSNANFAGAADAKKLLESIQP
ncbi:MAG: tetratricopeptide repeat protein [Vicinamibacterales bacterium]